MDSQYIGGPGATRLDVARGVGLLGSEVALRKILATVLVNLSADLSATGAALQADDVATASRKMHALKGYLPIFASEALIEQVVAVEQLSKTASAAIVRVPYAQLAPELHSLLAEIQHFLNTGQGS